MTWPTDLAAIRAAANRIRPHVHRTPVLTCASLDALAGRALFFKCENLQRTGSFKMRGAANAVFSLDAEAQKRGVVTHSSGNHAQALALAARDRGLRAVVVMPHTASSMKRQAVLDFGAEVIDCENTLADREASAQRVVDQTGATLVPPFDHPLVITGQGTVALELLEDVPELDAIVVAVGGGGLISGITLAAAELAPGLPIFGAEPALADDAAASKRAGVIQPQRPPRSIADGLLTSLGQHTWPVVRDLVPRIFTVEEDEIITAMRLFMERAKLVIEPSAAVPLAAVLSPEFRTLSDLQRVGIVLCGGNVDLSRLPF